MTLVYLTSSQTSNTVPVKIWVSAGANADTADLGLTYDASLGSYASFTAAAGWTPVVNSSLAGTLSVSMFDSGLGTNLIGTSTDGLLGTFNFTLASGATHFTASLVNTQDAVTDLGDASGNPITISTPFPITLDEAITCYLRGTKILTTEGEIAVEHLTEGMLVNTYRGVSRPVRWVGRQSFSGRFLGKSGAPVRIIAGALGAQSPQQDLWVSPDHSILIDELFVQAKLLINDITITQAATHDDVDYYHVDLGAHECILANGAWTESYAEMFNRNSFHNVAAYYAKYPGQASTFQAMCFPQVGGDDLRLPALRARVVANIPASHLSATPDIHLIVDAIRVDPHLENQGSWSFQLPVGARMVQLCSLTTAPAELGMSGDDRALGIAVTKLEAKGEGWSATVVPRDYTAAQGFWQVEDTEWRWTSGSATIPTFMFYQRVTEVTLTVIGFAMPTYLLRAGQSNAVDLGDRAFNDLNQQNNNVQTQSLRMSRSIIRRFEAG